jgi:hypothetical protein
VYKFYFDLGSSLVGKLKAARGRKPLGAATVATRVFIFFVRITVYMSLAISIDLCLVNG